jgi:hypothetical protein
MAQVFGILATFGVVGFGVFTSRYVKLPFNATNVEKNLQLGWDRRAQEIRHAESIEHFR